MGGLCQWGVSLVGLGRGRRLDEWARNAKRHANEGTYKMSYSQDVGTGGRLRCEHGTPRQAFTSDTKVWQEEPPLTWEHEGGIKEMRRVAFAKSEFPMYRQLPNAKWGAK